MHPALLITIIVASSALVLAVLIQLARAYMLKPGRRNEQMRRFTEIRYAHRGLHDGALAENSLSAFAAAKAASYGIELDIRLSKSGELVVFHDATLNRVCGVEGKVIDRTVDELSRLSLCGTKDYVPTFRELLELIDGAVPLLIEIKCEGDESGVAERFIKEIEGYRGEFIVESFNPMVLKIVKKARPDILIGILSTDYTREEKYRGKLLFKLLAKLYLNFLMRPDFIAYEKSGHSVKTLRYIRKKFNTPLIAWTVTSQAEEIRALGDGFDTVIFEGYIPEN